MAQDSSISTETPTRQPIDLAQAPRKFGQRRKALTLIEMLVSVTLTLLVVFAIVQVFEFLGDSVSLGRATIEMAGQMRSVAHRLQVDLDNRTCPAKPWIDPGSGLGYFEIIEGEEKDISRSDFLGGHPANSTGALGDRDDVIAMTVTSAERVYGNYKLFPDQSADDRVTPIFSTTAEVIWHVILPESTAGHAVLVRRAMLIRPDLDPVAISAGNVGDGVLRYLLNNSVSVRWDEVNNQLIPNSLSDLTTRENRIHVWLPQFDSDNGTNLTQRFFPGFQRQYGFAVDPSNAISADSLGSDFGKSVVLSDVTAFDVRVYDPEASVKQESDLALSPGDPSYQTYNPPGNQVFQTGAFVDLGYFGAPSASAFSHRLFDSDYIDANDDGVPLSFFGSRATAFDTWSIGYERDGKDQDDDGLFDEGFDGIDNDGVNGIDDYMERETRPLFNVPLRGIEVRIRMIEVGTQQVRQVSVIGDFSEF